MTTLPRLDWTGRPVVREYGCTLCQRAGRPCWHREGIDPEYAAHLPHQSRHGPRDRRPTAAELLALHVAAEDRP